MRSAGILRVEGARRASGGGWLSTLSARGVTDTPRQLETVVLPISGFAPQMALLIRYCHAEILRAVGRPLIAPTAVQPPNAAEDSRAGANCKAAWQALAVRASHPQT